jgi:hypothetical protein
VLDLEDSSQRSGFAIHRTVSEPSSQAIRRELSE